VGVRRVRVRLVRGGGKEVARGWVERGVGRGWIILYDAVEGLREVDIWFRKHVFLCCV
jgi:hypothetical protein